MTHTQQVDHPEVICPQCNQPIWDYAFASKLNKCWNCGLAFDSPEEDEWEAQVKAWNRACDEADRENSNG